MIKLWVITTLMQDSGVYKVGIIPKSYKWSENLYILQKHHKLAEKW